MHKFYYISDIHNEVRKDNNEFYLLPKIEDEAKSYLILAGDIDKLRTSKNINESLTLFLKDVVFRFKAVFYVFGNHEYYGSTINHIEHKIRDLKNQLKADNFYILNNDIYEHNDFVIIGSTLWTNFDNNKNVMFNVEDKFTGMRDYRKIKFKNNSNYSKLKARNIFDINFQSKQFIFDAIKKHKNKKVIVITHHAPTKDFTFKDGFESAYGNSYEQEILETKPDFWIHGHIHTRVQFKIGDTTILSNPLGYNNQEELVEHFKEDAHFIINNKEEEISISYPKEKLSEEELNLYLNNLKG